MIIDEDQPHNNYKYVIISEDGIAFTNQEIKEPKILSMEDYVKKYEKARNDQQEIINSIKELIKTEFQEVLFHQRGNIETLIKQNEYSIQHEQNRAMFTYNTLDAKLSLEKQLQNLKLQFKSEQIEHIKYVGNFDEKGQGWGKIEHLLDGQISSYQIGQFQKDDNRYMLNGPGKLYEKEQASIYQATGYFYKNKLFGKDCQLLQDELTYEGEFYDNELNGIGAKKNQAKGSSEGYFQKSKLITGIIKEQGDQDFVFNSELKSRIIPENVIIKIRGKEVYKNDIFLINNNEEIEDKQIYVKCAKCENQIKKAQNICKCDKCYTVFCCICQESNIDEVHFENGCIRNNSYDLGDIPSKRQAKALKRNNKIMNAIDPIAYVLLFLFRIIFFVIGYPFYAYLAACDDILTNVFNMKDGVRLTPQVDRYYDKKILQLLKFYYICEVISKCCKKFTQMRLQFQQYF